MQSCTAPARFAGFSICTSVRRRSRSAPCGHLHARGRRRRDLPRARSCAGSRHFDGSTHGRDVRQAARAAATAAADRCMCSTRRRASTAAMPSSAAAFRSRSGLALADQMQHRPRVTACFFGDGAVAEGEFHESLNLAALWKLPVLFLCENNLYAMGTRLERAQAQTDLVTKARSYLMPAEPVDGMDVLAVEAATSTRGRRGPARRWARVSRVPDLPFSRALDVRRRAVSRQIGSRGMEAARSDRDVHRVAQGPRASQPMRVDRGHRDVRGG